MGLVVIIVASIIPTLTLVYFLSYFAARGWYRGKMQSIEYYCKQKGIKLQE